MECCDHTKKTRYFWDEKKKSSSSQYKTRRKIACSENLIVIKDQAGNTRRVAYLNKNNVNSVKNNPAREIPIPMYEMIPRICSCVALSACTVPA